MKLVLLLLSIFPAAALADDIRVLSGGAAKAFLDPLAGSYAAQAVKVEYLPMGPLTKALAAGRPVEMVVVTSEVVDGLKLGAGTPLAKVGIGVAVHANAPLTDLSSVGAFKRALQAAKSIVYIDPKIGTSGRHVDEVLRKLGIHDEVSRKATLGTGGYVVAPVGRGEIELGIHQISEILPVKGVRLAGALPPELQKYTTYVAVPVRESPAVRAFIAYLTGPQARARLEQAGYTAPL